VTKDQEGAAEATSPAPAPAPVSYDYRDDPNFRYMLPFRSSELYCLKFAGKYNCASDV
jgi:hypothetical protein